MKTATDSKTSWLVKEATMRILMIAPEPYFEPRGTPISIMQRLRALSQLGHQVDLLTYQVGQDVRFPGLTIYRTPKIGFIREVRIGPSPTKLLLDLILFFQAVWMLITRHYDIIHSHEEASFFAMVLGWVFRLPHLYDMHSSLPRQLANSKYRRLWPGIKLFEIFESAVLRSAAAVITIDADLEKYAKTINPALNQMQIDNLPLHNSATPVDRNAVQELKSKFALEGRIAAVYTGTLESYQGLELIIESAPYVRNQIPDIIYLIVGGRQSQIDYYQALAHAHGVGDIFIFTGNLLPDEALLYLALADILLSTRRDNTSVPLKIYSYLHAGKPIIATRNQAHLRILNEELALLVEPTVNAFGEGVCRLAVDGVLRARLQHNLHRFAATMQKDADYLNKVRMLYQSLAPSFTIYAKPAEKVEESIRQDADYVIFSQPVSKE
jgi:glycosyltransferase involved in cell wall biosynthesis